MNAGRRSGAVVTPGNGEPEAAALLAKPWSRRQWPRDQLRAHWPHLTLQQVELLKEVFQLFDTEDKGYFTKDDLFFVMEAMGGSPTPQELDAVMYELDSNGDSMVDFPEFLTKFLTATDEKELLSVFHQLAIQEGEGNDDRVLTIQAVERSFQYVGDPLSDEDKKYLQIIFDGADKDGNGRLDIKEFTAYLEKMDDELFLGGAVGAAGGPAGLLATAKAALAGRQGGRSARALRRSFAGSSFQADNVPEGEGGAGGSGTGPGGAAGVVDAQAFALAHGTSGFLSTSGHQHTDEQAEQATGHSGAGGASTSGLRSSLWGKIARTGRGTGRRTSGSSGNLLAALTGHGLSGGGSAVGNALLTTGAGAGGGRGGSGMFTTQRSSGLNAPPASAGGASTSSTSGVALLSPAAAAALAGGGGGGSEPSPLRQTDSGLGEGSAAGGAGQAGSLLRAESSGEAFPFPSPFAAAGLAAAPSVQLGPGWGGAGAGGSAGHSNDGGPVSGDVASTQQLYGRRSSLHRQFSNPQQPGPPGAGFGTAAGTAAGQPSPTLTPTTPRSLGPAPPSLALGQLPSAPTLSPSPVPQVISPAAAAMAAAAAAAAMSAAASERAAKRHMGFTSLTARLRLPQMETRRQASVIQEAPEEGDSGYPVAGGSAALGRSSRTSGVGHGSAAGGGGGAGTAAAHSGAGAAGAAGAGAGAGAHHADPSYARLGSLPERLSPAVGAAREGSATASGGPLRVGSGGDSRRGWRMGGLVAAAAAAFGRQRSWGRAWGSNSGQASPADQTSSSPSPVRRSTMGQVGPATRAGSGQTSGQASGHVVQVSTSAGGAAPEVPERSGPPSPSPAEARLPLGPPAPSLVHPLEAQGRGAVAEAVEHSSAMEAGASAAGTWDLPGAWSLVDWLRGRGSGGAGGWGHERQGAPGGPEASGPQQSVGGPGFPGSPPPAAAGVLPHAGAPGWAPAAATVSTSAAVTTVVHQPGAQPAWVVSRPGPSLQPPQPAAAPGDWSCASRPSALESPGSGAAPPPAQVPVLLRPPAWAGSALASPRSDGAGPGPAGAFGSGRGTGITASALPLPPPPLAGSQGTNPSAPARPHEAPQPSRLGWPWQHPNGQLEAPSCSRRVWSERGAPDGGVRRWGSARHSPAIDAGGWDVEEAEARPPTDASAVHRGPSGTNGWRSFSLGHDSGVGQQPGAGEQQEPGSAPGLAQLCRLGSSGRVGPPLRPPPQATCREHERSQSGQWSSGNGNGGGTAGGLQADGRGATAGGSHGTGTAPAGVPMPAPAPSEPLLSVHQGPPWRA
ncbi:hypothetical protein HYH03_013978 [Edaphochlamys debaryana]|uniref:EF-hand domain-containing protein n=1 Tax=Edaphochlamys debaryana TaxID=47281 RepID=A0A835XPN3_9CHLO|nr:hypothetical protein HYH03_013978 [Edaphochlamys debaryana]|eukprot:KAG2487409.1 hypothetical protein HYH03_013978 [Edaphochlamys debaryana]